MDIIRATLPPTATGVLEILLHIDRLTLEKRRWRAAAEDGREFGFDLETPLRDGAPFFHAGGATYLISQQPEPVLEISLTEPSDSARLGWQIGNLHFSLQIVGNSIRVADDPALRRLFDREQITYSGARRVYHPERRAHVH